MQRHSTLKKICNAQKSCQDDPILSVIKRFTEHPNLISLQHSDPSFSFNLPIQTKLFKENKSVRIYTRHSQKSKNKLFVFFHKFCIKILITRYLFQFYPPSPPPPPLPPPLSTFYKKPVYKSGEIHMKGSYRRQIDKYLADYFQSTWEIHVFSKYFESLLSKDLFPFRIGLSALHYLLLFTAELP